ncbi:MAG TPA: glycogen debranching enzyme N-terminal domain-containing protein, partial [Phycisphaerae bacterium]|nr:glycogen debranching enzyme N-terminal domain-containing protein [Phycisphaerae bacterium]
MAERVACEAAEFGRQLSREWLLTNGRGGFASGTSIGVPTRRYHGLLVAAARPPLERWMLLSATLERVGTMDWSAETPGFCFGDVCHPRGFDWQADFVVSNHPPTGYARFVYAWDDLCLTKCVYMSRGHDEVAVHLRLESSRPIPLSLEIRPFTAMRDYHHLTRAFEGGFPVGQVDGRVVVGGRDGTPRLWLQAEAVEGARDVIFSPQPDWWYGFFYRQEAHRGQDCREDLFTPGWFKATGTGCLEVTLRAAADFGGEDRSGGERFTMMVPDGQPAAFPTAVNDRLVESADAFVVKRKRVDGSESATILAGYPWFGDWGRDTFIALPGLLVETGRFSEAREVLATFASAQKDGLIPNRFSDYGDGCDYNSVDASLWYIHAADAYCRSSGDEAAWREWLE